MSNGPFTLSAAERLKSKKDIDTLFRQGEAFFVYPFKVFYTFKPTQHPALQMGVSAPKKLFRQSVQRNYLKRLVREAYRLQKPALQQIQQSEGLQLQLMLVYATTGKFTYDKVYHSIGNILDKLIKKAHPGDVGEAKKEA
ncbi:MAG: ribonuclease P protein component [Chitinophagaceae bacterium]|jgi:ribonuclease P protein component|nr:ribonuclease P protein component [Chitinophagaceae bacterium]